MKGLAPVVSCLLLGPRLAAASLEEGFAADPLIAGWTTFGNASLFHWNNIAQALEVRWDSSQPNSYFLRPLGTILAKTDDIELSFDLRLSELAVGVEPGKPVTFELAVALVNRSDATARPLSAAQPASRLISSNSTTSPIAASARPSRR